MVGLLGFACSLLLVRAVSPGRGSTHDSKRRKPTRPVPLARVGRRRGIARLRAVLRLRRIQRDIPTRPDSRLAPSLPLLLREERSASLPKGRHRHARAPSCSVAALTPPPGPEAAFPPLWHVGFRAPGGTGSPVASIDAPPGSHTRSPRSDIEIMGPEGSRTARSASVRGPSRRGGRNGARGSGRAWSRTRALRPRRSARTRGSRSAWRTAGVFSWRWKLRGVRKAPRNASGRRSRSCGRSIGKDTSALR